jgi:hypothetical protein
LSPLFKMQCKGCGHETEIWVPFHNQREQRAVETPCIVCGKNEWRFMPADFSWHWGERIKGKG